MTEIKTQAKATPIADLALTIIKKLKEKEAVEAASSETYVQNKGRS